MHVTNPLPDTLVIKVDKSLDFRNASAFKELCLNHVRSGKLHFILDFSETGILDSTGLGSVFAVYRQVSEQNGSIMFASPSRPVEVVVKLTRTDRVFQQHASVDEALLAVRAEKAKRASRPVFKHESVYTTTSK